MNPNRGNSLGNAACLGWGDRQAMPFGSTLYAGLTMVCRMCVHTCARVKSEAQALEGTQPFAGIGN